VALARGPAIQPHHLPPELLTADPLVATPWWRGQTALADVERQALLHALRQTGGNKVEAAKLLRISERSLYRKLDRHRLRDRPAT
jgi:DNA-binding NtrC family response regulator